jgi:catechol 2,3-dioxygenase-like lactoylglutathione lyase family enzyme
MRIAMTSVFVEDQDKAHEFYTKILGFLTKSNFPVGEFKWLTVISPEGSGEMELLLEPNDNPIARTYQKALFEQGIPSATYMVDDIQDEVERLTKLGVVFKMEPRETGEVIIAIFEDTCGNLIQIAQSG